MIARVRYIYVTGSICSQCRWPVQPRQRRLSSVASISHCACTCKRAYDAGPVHLAHHIITLVCYIHVSGAVHGHTRAAIQLRICRQATIACIATCGGTRPAAITCKP